MVSVFSTVWVLQPPHSPWPPHMSPVILGGSGPHAHRVTLGITALGCGFPPAGHLQFGLLFHPQNLHHPSQLHHLSSVLLDFGGAAGLAGHPFSGPLRVVLLLAMVPWSWCWVGGTPSLPPWLGPWAHGGEQTLQIVPGAIHSARATALSSLNYFGSLALMVPS